MQGPHVDFVEVLLTGALVVMMAMIVIFTASPAPCSPAGALCTWENGKLIEVYGGIEDGRIARKAGP